MDTDSLEDYSNDTEFGQDLIDLLLQRGEIELKLNDNDGVSKVRRGENMKNDRYDELINAFNVILEEILRQGKLTKQTDSFDNNEPNHNQIDENTSRRCRSKHTTKCTTGRCLNNVESSLLEKINVLNDQLHRLIGNKNQKRGADDRNSDPSDADLKYDANKSLPNVNHSGENPTVNADNSQLDGSKLKLIPTTNDQYKTVTQSNIQKVTEEERKNIDYGVSSVGKRHAQPDETPEQVLNKENNYGVEQLEIAEDEIQNSDEEQDYYPNVSSNNEQNDDPPKSDDDSTKRKSNNSPVIPVIASSGIDIPLRIVQRPNGGFSLVLDRRSLCQNRRCGARKNNNQT